VVLEAVCTIKEQYVKQLSGAQVPEMPSKTASAAKIKLLLPPEGLSLISLEN
jgi:hypothetical protein